MKDKPLSIAVRVLLSSVDTIGDLQESGDDSDDEGDVSRSERIPSCLLRGWRANSIRNTTLRIEESLQLAAGSFNARSSRRAAMGDIVLTTRKKKSPARMKGLIAAMIDEKASAGKLHAGLRNGKGAENAELSRPE